MRFQARRLRQLETPLLPDLLGLVAAQTPIQELLGGSGVLALGGDGAGVHDVLVRVGRHGADDLHAAEAVHVGGVHEGDVDIAGLGMLAHTLPTEVSVTTLWPASTKAW